MSHEVSFDVSEFELGACACNFPPLTAWRDRFVSEFILQNPVVPRVYIAIYWINHYPLDNSIGFATVYPLDSDLCGG